MSLTPIGAVALLFAGYSLICRPTWIYLSAIFFMAFSATAFVNIGGSFGLGLSLFFFFCYALVLVMGRDGGPRVAYSKDQVAPLCLTLFLALAVLVSLCGPILRGELLPINVSVSVFSGVGLALIWLTVAFIDSTDRLLTVLRVEFGSVLFVTGWGAFQLACALLQLPYPALIFNNSASHFALLYGAEASGGYVRVGSVAVEPSILVQSIGIPCSIAATLLALGVPQLRRWSVATVVAGALTTLFSTSTTGYLGAAVLLGLLFTERPKRILAVAPFTVLLVAGIAAAVPNLTGAIAETTVEKLQSWSFDHRFDSIQAGLAAFIAHPIVGMGWGTEMAKSLPIFLLANLGLIGTVIFGLLVGSLIVGLISIRAQLHHRAEGKDGEDRLLAALCLGAFNAFIVSLVMQSAAGPTYAFPDFWVLIGLMIALHRATGAAVHPRKRPARSTIHAPHVYDRSAS